MSEVNAPTSQRVLFSKAKTAKGNDGPFTTTGRFAGPLSSERATGAGVSQYTLGGASGISIYWDRSKTWMPFVIQGAEWVMDMSGRTEIIRQPKRVATAICLVHGGGIGVLTLISYLFNLHFNEAFIFFIALVPPAVIAAMFWRQAELGLFVDLTNLAPVIHRPFRASQIVPVLFVLTGVAGLTAAMYWPGVPSGLPTKEGTRYVAIQHQTQIIISKSQYDFMIIGDNLAYSSFGILLDGFALAMIYVVGLPASLDTR